MKILSIETSCDETAISIVEAKGGKTKPTFTLLGDALFSQAHLHEKYGGVFPNLAKREHTKNIAPLTEMALKDAKLLQKKKKSQLSIKYITYLENLLERDKGLATELINLFKNYKKPAIHYIAVTNGPGLEPALWVGVNTARAMSYIWNIPLIPINHMEGHALASLLQVEKNIKGNEVLYIPKIHFPAIALLISGGHSELVLIKDWLSYKVLGQTRDDAIGEAFDKVARMLKLPYPGGPEISRLAKTVKESSHRFTFPRPMIHSGDLDFSFSGIKTSVLYTIKKIPRLSAKMKAEIAYEFETAVTEVLVAKTTSAVKKTKAKTLIIGGGVSANNHIRKTLLDAAIDKMDGIDFYIPTKNLSTDNAIMIAISAYMQLVIKGEKMVVINSDLKLKKLGVNGNMKL